MIWSISIPYFLSNWFTFRTMFPFIEVVPLAIVSNVSKHSGQEFLFKISPFCSDFQLMHVDSFSSFDDTVKNSTNIAWSKRFVLSITFFCTHYELLPMLESFRLVKILHSIQDFWHQFSSLFLIFNIFMPCIPKVS